MSASGKLRDLRAFRAAVEDFAIVPRAWAGRTSIAVVAGELVLVLGLAAGGALLPVVFLGATALLLVFTVALVHAIRHRGVVNCNCFGAATARLSVYDVARNGCLIVCSVAGVWAASDAGTHGIRTPEAIAVLLAGIGLAMLLINFADVARTIRRPFTVPGVA